MSISIFISRHLKPSIVYPLFTKIPSDPHKHVKCTIYLYGDLVCKQDKHAVPFLALVGLAGISEFFVCLFI